MSAVVNRETVNDTAKLMMHRLIARELARNPALLSRAVASLSKMAARYPDRSFIQDWERLLRRPVHEITAMLTARSEEATRLRLSSPFVLAEGIDFKDEGLRRRIDRAAKRVVVRRSTRSADHGTQYSFR